MVAIQINKLTKNNFDSCCIFHTQNKTTATVISFSLLRQNCIYITIKSNYICIITYYTNETQVSQADYFPIRINLIMYVCI